MHDFDFKDLDQHLSAYKADFKPDVESGLARLHGRVDVVRPAAKVRRLGWGSWPAIAATVLLLLTAGYLVLAGDGSTTHFNDTSAPMAVSLPDGTDVLLQQGGELTYGADYNETDRLIDLNGQAFFKVAKIADRPFLVNTSETELRVTGTAFNLRVAEDELEVEVSEGIIELHREGEVTKVGAKQCGLALPGKPCSLMKAANLNRHAWRTGTLTFHATPLAVAIKTIANNYGLTVESPADCDFPVSGTFASDDPVAVLRTFAQLGGGEVKVDSDKEFALVGICN